MANLLFSNGSLPSEKAHVIDPTGHEQGGCSLRDRFLSRHLFCNWRLLARSTNSV